MMVMAQLQARWRSVSAREQRLLMLAMVLVLLALVWWLAVAPALAVLKAAPAQHRALDAQLQHMLSLQAQAKVLQTQAVFSAQAQRSALDASLKPLGTAAQMTVQFDRVTVTLKGVSADALAHWLSTVRQNAHVVPSEAHLVRHGELGWDGTLVLNLGTPS
jgi:general secretion pathway protein M